MEEIFEKNEPTVRKKKMSPKRRFRAIVRLVIANAAWLVDSVDAKYGTKLYNLKKAMKSSLSLEHKAILNKAPEDRTQEDNTLIYKMIGGFKCFRKYPENVKMMLASYSHFCYFGPDRVIVRENHYATAIFFIISGEVSIIEEKYDAFLDETERIVTETLQPGDVFGEICLLYQLPRMETIISNTPVEFLILKRNDFDIVLKSTVKEEWDYISSVMQSFDYFQDWDKIRIGECCMQSFIKRFKKDDTVLGDGYGRKNYVHFVIEGKCVLIEHLKVEEVLLPYGTTTYRIYTQPYGQSRIGFNIPPPRSRIKSKVMSSKNSLVKKPLPSGIELHKQYSTFTRARKSSYLPSVNSEQSDRQSSDHEISFSCPLRSVLIPTKNVEIVFMQVCIFSEKSCFSLGESMTNRRIVADGDLICLLIPWYVLVGRDNIWLRIKQFLTKRIPTTEVVFDRFLKQRQWRKYKSDLIKPFVSSYCTNWFCNVPYSIRIHNDFDFKSEEVDPKHRTYNNSIANASPN